MFLPLLKMVDGEGQLERLDLGKLAFLIDWFDFFDVKISIFSILIIMFLFFSFKGIARFLESFYKIKLKNYFITKLRFELLDSLGGFSYKSFVNSDSGKIQNTLSGEIGRVVNAYNSYFLAVQGLVMVAVYTTLAFLANPQFAILVIIGGLASNFIFNVINEKTINASRNLSSQGHDFQGLLIQKVANFKYLKATGSMSTYITKLKRIALDIESTNQRMGIYGAFLNAVKEPLIIGIVVSVILVQITFMDKNIGLIILSLLFFFRSLTFLMNLQTHWNGFLSNVGALENLDEFHSHLKENKDKTGGLPIIEFKNEIELKKYSKIPTDNENPVYKEEFEDIYLEREWRTFADLEFFLADLSMVVARTREEKDSIMENKIIQSWLPKGLAVICLDDMFPVRQTKGLKL
jgi:subfamily B ATP-binding cassette protein MsbA